MIPEEASKLQDEILRKMPGWKRLKISCDLYDFARALVRSRIKSKHPELGDEEVERLVTERFKR